MDCESLNKLKGAALRQLYVEVIGQSPPPKASHHFLKGNIAWTIQTQASGQDPSVLRQALLQDGKSSANHKKTLYKPGTRLVREWQGKIYEVTIHEHGYEFNGSKFRSLSQIANLITGSHCSGPRFFGLHKKA